MLTFQSDFEAHFYVRITINDGLGVIRHVGQIAEESGVSIYSILQAPIVDRANVQFVVTTETSMLSKIRLMCKKIAELPFVQEEPLFLPIM